MLVQDRVEFHRATGSAAMSVTMSRSRRPWRFHSLRVNVSATATQENLVVHIDSHVNPVYDVVLLTKAMAGVDDYVWTPERNTYIDKDDVLTISWNNTDAVTYGVEIVYEP